MAPPAPSRIVALQMLPQLMGVARGTDGEKIMIVTATSGDTGKARARRLRGCRGQWASTVFYPARQGLRHPAPPDGHAAWLQRGRLRRERHLRRLPGPGQARLCRPRARRAPRRSRAWRSSSAATPINVGRLAPQVTYYFDAYAQLVRREAIRPGDEVTFCVPTGNFGDVLAGYYAKRLGLPVRRLVVASNAKRRSSRTSSRPAPTTAGAPSTRPSRPRWTSSSRPNLERPALLCLRRRLRARGLPHGRPCREGASTPCLERVMEEIRSVFSCGRADDEATRADHPRRLARARRPHRPAHGRRQARAGRDAERRHRARLPLHGRVPTSSAPTCWPPSARSSTRMNGFACMDALERAHRDRGAAAALGPARRRGSCTMTSATPSAWAPSSSRPAPGCSCDRRRRTGAPGRDCARARDERQRRRGL